MSFKASLTIGGKTYDLLSCSYSFSRDVDHKGRPASIVYGGTVSCSIESTEDTTVLETMLNSKHKSLSGTITFYKREEDNAKMKEITITDGYLIAFTESIEATGGNPMHMNFTISARELKIGNATHSNEWPQAS